MATYRDIQDRVRREHERAVKTCWIADVKEMNGLKPRVSPNRLRADERKHPCPDWARLMIEDAMRELGMLA